MDFFRRQLDPDGPDPARRVPFWLKVFHTLFLAVLVPAYWVHYGPVNFLWFSDVALFLVLLAVWLEHPLPASMGALAVGLLELGWLVDFLAGLLMGRSPLGISAYMFKEEIPLRMRALSLFHVWLPFLLFWLVWRLGYDRRALPVQTALAWVVLPLSFLLSTPKANVNWVFGPGGEQTWLPPPLYLLVLLALFPLCVYLPTHLLLLWLFPRARRPQE